MYCPPFHLGAKDYYCVVECMIVISLRMGVAHLGQITKMGVVRKVFMELCANNRHMNIVMVISKYLSLAL